MTSSPTTNLSYPIVGIGLVGKSNKPICIYSLENDRESDLDLNLTIHSCLDIIDERADSTTSTNLLPYLGFLSLLGRHAAYGMIGPTRVRVFCVLEADFEPTPREEDMKQFLTALHQVYCDWICNPFVEVVISEGDPIPNETSKVFFERIKRLCENNHFVPK